MKINIQYHHSEVDSGVPNELLQILLGERKYGKHINLSRNAKNEVDYIISNNSGIPLVGIERKSIDDLVGSIESRRVKAQLYRMIEMKLIPILLVEGILPDSTQTKMLWKSIYGLMSKISEAKIIVYHTTDFQHTALRILNASLDVKAGRFGIFEVPVIKIKADHPVLQTLMSFDGVGEEIAAKIYKRYDNLETFLIDCQIQHTDGVSSLMDVDGIAEKLADKIADSVVRRWK